MSYTFLSIIGQIDDFRLCSTGRCKSGELLWPWGHGILCEVVDFTSFPLDHRSSLLLDFTLRLADIVSIL